MLMMPDFIGDEDVGRARKRTREKGDLPSLAKLRLRRFHEGRAVQVGDRGGRRRRSFRTIIRLPVR